MLQFDDMGLDEYDVADERQHEIGFDRWEINLDNMSYEELLALQARIGYVNKGLDLDSIRQFPQMTKAQLRQYLKESKKQSQKQAVQPDHLGPELGTNFEQDPQLLQSRSVGSLSHCHESPYRFQQPSLLPPYLVEHLSELSVHDRSRYSNAQ